MMTKHVGKTRVVNVRSFVKSGGYKWYLRQPHPMRCALETNQAETGGHVTPGAEEG